MERQRNIHLNRLMSRRHNGMIKVVTGLLRCGKSYLLFNLFELSEYISFWRGLSVQ